MLDNASVSEAVCRETLRQKYDVCYRGVCPQCISPCNYEVARTIGSVLKCVDFRRHFGFVHFYHTTDAGICLTSNPWWCLQT